MIFWSPLPRQFPALLLRFVEWFNERRYVDEQIHNLYGVLFHWIGNESLRPLVVHLLYRMTRPQDILTWRVHKLYPLPLTIPSFLWPSFEKYSLNSDHTCELRNKVGSEPAIDALLALYREYRPLPISAVLPSRTKSVGSLLRVHPSLSPVILLEEILSFCSQQERAAIFTNEQWNYKEMPLLLCSFLTILFTNVLSPSNHPLL